MRPLEHVELLLEPSANVEILELSECGVLLASPLPMPTGLRGELRAVLGREPFSAVIEIQRSTREPHPKPWFQVGAAFVSVDDRSRHVLRRFLERNHRNGDDSSH